MIFFVLAGAHLPLNDLARGAMLLLGLGYVLARVAGRPTEHSVFAGWLDSALLGDAGVLAHPVRGAMRGDNAPLVRDAELVEDFDSRAERIPVRLAAHNDANERFFHGGRQCPNFLR